MLETYVAQFSKLRSDKSEARWPLGTMHRAPHKPLLLLAVLDRFAEGSAVPNLIEPSPELGELFTLYWARVMPPDQRGSLALPFFHLKSDGFWHLLPAPGKETYLLPCGRFAPQTNCGKLSLGRRLMMTCTPFSIRGWHGKHFGGF